MKTKTTLFIAIGMVGLIFAGVAQAGLLGDLGEVLGLGGNETNITIPPQIKCTELSQYDANIEIDVDFNNTVSYHADIMCGEQSRFIRARDLPNKGRLPAEDVAEADIKSKYSTGELNFDPPVEEVKRVVTKVIQK